MAIKSNVRWVKIMNDNKKGLLFKGDQWLNFSAHEYTLENLTQAKHSIDIHEAGFISLYIDHKQAGLGGDDSWTPRTHPEFQLSDEKFEFTFEIIPF
ncbi:MAG: hypothetical protein HC906_00810 [Bacteroidales bacterium]|nr:hypothetical protein [Bacteroidales bacterium]